jgi:putative inorganic carbon (hco3(-)) transporter
MRGLILLIVFFAALPFIFFNGPFFGILLWYWVSLMNPQKLVWNSFAAGISYAHIVAVTTLLCWFLSKVEPKLPPMNKTTGLLVMLAVWISVTSILGTGPSNQIYEKWQLAEKMLLMTIVAYTLTTSRQRLDQLIVVCTLSIAFFGFKGGLSSLLFSGGTAHIYGPDGTMIGDNNDLGVALTMVLPLLFYMRERYRQPYLKWPFLVLIGLTFLGDIFTYSRGALLALFAVGAMLWWRSRRKVSMGLLIAVAAVGVWNYAPEEWFARMGTIQSYQADASAETRVYLWHLAWAMALKRPITGAGFHWSNNPASVNRELSDSGLPPLTMPRAPHSNWFEMLGDHGFVGLAIFIAILISTAVDARWLVRHSRGNPDLEWANTLGRMLQASLVGYCAGGSFATQAMFDGFYAVVIIAAAARRIVAAEITTRNAAAFGTAASVIPRLGSGLRPQPTV